MIALYLLIGFVGGVAGGMFGIGGGAIMVPALLYLFHMTQHQAQGTTLAIMLPPIGLLAALRYYYAGHVNVKIAVFVALGFFFGALLGADLVQDISSPNLKRAFGIFLIVIGTKMVLGK